MGQRIVEGVAPGAGDELSAEGTGDGGAPTSVKLGVYLRRLREGYGYTLRKVEERAQELAFFAGFH